MSIWGPGSTGEEPRCPEKSDRKWEQCPSGADGAVTEDPGRAKWKEGVKSELRAVLSPGPVARWEERMLAWRRGLITGVMLRCEQLIRKAQSACALRGLASVKETK